MNVLIFGKQKKNFGIWLSHYQSRPKMSISQIDVLFWNSSRIVFQVFGMIANNVILFFKVGSEVGRIPFHVKFLGR